MSLLTGSSVIPEVGGRYVFEDFVGARFEATLRSMSMLEDGHMRLEFEDREPFETNLPMTAVPA